MSETIRLDRPALVVHSWGDPSDAVAYPRVGRELSAHLPIGARPCVTYFDVEPIGCCCSHLYLEALHP